MRAVISVVFLIFLVLSVTSCSSRQLGYRYAETLISWQAGRFVDLTDEQDAVLREETNLFLQWHAEQHMPHYHQLLSELATDIRATTISPERIDYFQKHMEGYWLEIRQQLIAPSVRLLSMLDDEQVAQLLTKLTENREERAEEAVEATNKDQRQERVLRSLRRYAGRPSAEQQQIVATWHAETPDVQTDWIAYQGRWQDAFTEALAARHSTDFAKQLSDLFLHPEQFRGAAMAATLEDSNQASKAMLIELHNSLSNRQTTRVWQRITRLQRDLAAMAKQRDVEL
ncbi:DUF6279 family lipoprotein [Aliidiomarina sp.]|uniref:DUF6279 family lipoprotein n=1 Tax=Aliidiomarina sp. TaxID=1872439 RepID=UPI003A4D8035